MECAHVNINIGICTFHSKHWNVHVSQQADMDNCMQERYRITGLHSDSIITGFVKINFESV